MEGRPIVREANLEQFQKEPDFAKRLNMHAPPGGMQSLYPNPLDEAIVATVRKTNRVLLAHEDTRTGGVAAEITARTGKDPGVHYREIEKELGSACYTRIDAPATAEVVLHAIADREHVIAVGNVERVGA